MFICPIILNIKSSGQTNLISNIRCNLVISNLNRASSIDESMFQKSCMLDKVSQLLWIGIFFHLLFCPEIDNYVNKLLASLLILNWFPLIILKSFKKKYSLKIKIFRLILSLLHLLLYMAKKGRHSRTWYQNELIECTS